MKYINTKNVRLYMSVVLALVMVLSMSIFSYADGEKMQWHFPQPNDDMIYYWEFEKNVQEVQFNDIAMYLEFDVSDNGRQHLINAKWLPELSAEELETASTFNTSFYQHLKGISEYITEADIYGADVDELVKMSGLSTEEAQEKWFKILSVNTAYTFPYKIEIFDNFDLCGRDAIVGAYGAEAVSVDEAVINGYDAVKAAIDYTHVYDDNNLNEEEWENIKKSIFKNYIFLFEPECEYMICVSGTMDMDVLEKIAENLDVCETELQRSSYNTGVNYLLMDLAKG